MPSKADPPASPSRLRPYFWTWSALGLVALAAAGAWLVRRAPRRTDAAARRLIAVRRPAPGSVNVVVVTLDTLRADRLGCYGFGGVATPNIDAVADEGVVFEQATSTAPMTLPSHVSIFTGLLPPHHGVRDNGGFYVEAKTTTLASRLQHAGFATGAFVGAWVLESRWGLDQGFDVYSDRFDLSKYKVVNLGTVQKKGDEVMDLALAWLETVKDRRFFAWVHLYDPHTPYEPPEPFLSRYPGQPYLGEIAYTDQVVGRLVHWLKASGQWEKTILVLMADHGESLGEHGEATHTFFVYDATQHVPFVVRTPWGDRGRSRAQVSTVDLMPTLLDLLQLAPQEGIDGHSRARLVLNPGSESQAVAYSETYFPRFHYGWQHLRALRDGHYKYIEAPTPELYDVRADPAETKNLYKGFSRRAEELRATLERLAGSGVQAAPDKDALDPETLQRLAALGYVGGGPRVDPAALLPDPKDKIGVFGRLGRARALARDDKLEEAVAAMRAVVAEDPGIVDAYTSLGGWLLQLGRLDEAVASYRRVLEIDPQNALALPALADAYRAQGRPEAAIEGYRSAVRLAPRQPHVWYQLATLYLELGRRAEAEATFREALKHNPKMGAAYNSLAALAFERGRYDEAERLVRKGLLLEDDLRSSRFNLARVLETRGDTAGAERLYREELERFADHGRARFNLAQLLRQKGDRAGYLAELRLATEKAPEFGPAFFFLARERLEAGQLEEAAELARRGLKVDEASELAPLGHYVLADVDTRQGRRVEAEAELLAGRRLQARHRVAPGGE
ncbi:MAG TPA: sulfatase-like hydrolase/transferase [Vicinamibacteria bacterium]|nr:sulfatase-like hydrolase/transferase [Vicinamibacteria bacterium]